MKLWIICAFLVCLLVMLPSSHADRPRHCHRLCPRNIDPVCAVNYQRFPNKCVMENSNCDSNAHWRPVKMSRCH